MSEMITLSNGRKISIDTIEAMAEEYFKTHPEPKPKFEPISIHDGCFVVGVEKNYVTVKTGDTYNDDLDGCKHPTEVTGEFIDALQKAKEYVKKYKK